MRNARQETISEHSMEVSMLAHALAVIGNKRLGKNYNAEKAALIGLYHDANEIITIINMNINFICCSISGV